MSAGLFFTVIICYFLSLILISRITSRKADDADYFIGSRQSPWYLVAFGMLSDSLSGVTYISVPGAVMKASLTYMQVVIGYFIGYYLIVWLLLPLYYRLNLISIYSYLRNRFGVNAQKTGSFYFLISRLLGAGGRLMLAISVMQLFVFDSYHIPFEATAAIFIGLMLLYTYRGGIKTLVYTDAFQSLFLILGVVLSIYAITSSLNLDFKGYLNSITDSPYSKLFETDPMKSNFWLKNIISGALFTVGMTGLDQNMMQKNLSMRSLKDAQKNMIWFSFVLLIVNILFLSLGIMLYKYADAMHLSLPLNESGAVATDKVFPSLAMSEFGTFTSLAFIIGLTAATFSSADSVLATLTTSFCIDFLKMDNPDDHSDKHKQIRHRVHIGFAAALLGVIIFLKNAFSGTTTIDLILNLASFSYGPLLGLFAAGLFTRYQFKDRWIPAISIIAPIICYLLSTKSEAWLGGYKIGNELILLNGLLTFIFLLLLRSENRQPSGHEV